MDTLHPERDEPEELQAPVFEIQPDPAVMDYIGRLLSDIRDEVPAEAVAVDIKDDLIGAERARIRDSFRTHRNAPKRKFGRNFEESFDLGMQTRPQFSALHKVSRVPHFLVNLNNPFANILDSPNLNNARVLALKKMTQAELLREGINTRIDSAFEEIMNGRDGLQLIMATAGEVVATLEKQLGKQEDPVSLLGRTIVRKNDFQLQIEQQVEKVELARQAVEAEEDQREIRAKRAELLRAEQQLHHIEAMASRDLEGLQAEAQAIRQRIHNYQHSMLVDLPAFLTASGGTTLQDAQNAVGAEFGKLWQKERGRDFSNSRMESLARVADLIAETRKIAKTHFTARHLREAAATFADNPHFAELPLAPSPADLLILNPPAPGENSARDAQNLLLGSKESFGFDLKVFRDDDAQSAEELARRDRERATQENEVIRLEGRVLDLDIQVRQGNHELDAEALRLIRIDLTQFRLDLDATYTAARDTDAFRIEIARRYEQLARTVADRARTAGTSLDREARGLEALIPEARKELRRAESRGDAVARGEAVARNATLEADLRAVHTRQERFKALQSAAGLSKNNTNEERLEFIAQLEACLLPDVLPLRSAETTAERTVRITALLERVVAQTAESARLRAQSEQAQMTLSNLLNLERGIRPARAAHKPTGTELEQMSNRELHLKRVEQLEEFVNSLESSVRRIHATIDLASKDPAAAAHATLHTEVANNLDFLLRDLESQRTSIVNAAALFQSGLSAIAEEGAVDALRTVRDNKRLGLDQAQEELRLARENHAVAGLVTDPKKIPQAVEAIAKATKKVQAEEAALTAAVAEFDRAQAAYLPKKNLMDEQQGILRDAQARLVGRAEAIRDMMDVLAVPYGDAVRDMNAADMGAASVALRNARADREKLRLEKPGEHVLIRLRELAQGVRASRLAGVTATTAAADVQRGRINAHVSAQLAVLTEIEKSLVGAYRTRDLEKANDIRIAGRNEYGEAIEAVPGGERFRKHFEQDPQERVLAARQREFLRADVEAFVNARESQYQQPKGGKSTGRKEDLDKLIYGEFRSRQEERLRQGAHLRISPVEEEAGLQAGELFRFQPTDRVHRAALVKARRIDTIAVMSLIRRADERIWQDISAGRRASFMIGSY